MARMSTGKKVLVAVNIIALIGLTGATGYLFFENQDLKDNASLTTEQRNQQIIDEINAVFDLPDEEPVVAIVTDPEEFKREYQAFANAEAGDYLLFFRKARLNVLYRQSERRVVNTADVIVPITVELVGEQEAIDEAEAGLVDFGDQIQIVKTPVSGITQSFVFDIDADQEQEATQIADVVGYDIGATLPSTIAPGAQTEILIAVSSAPAAEPATVDSEANP